MASGEVTLSTERKPVPEEEGRQREGLLQEGDSSGRQVVGFTSDARRPHAPPTYEEAMDPSAAPPPSYESLYGRVREVHKESNGTFDFVKNVIILLLGTIGCTICMALTIIFPLSMLCIGFIYLNDCPANKNIPIYLVVGGAFGILKQLMSMYERMRKCCQNESENERKDRFSSFQSLVGLFVFIWFICGNYWVYSTYKPSFKVGAVNYCSKVCYWFAFWQITVSYIILGLTACCFCVASTTLVFCARRMEWEERSGPSQT